MKKLWKSYAVFSSWIYRLMTLLVIPVVFIIGGYELSTLVEADMTMIAFKLFVGLILTYEVLNDYWLFGGICSLDGCNIESLKLAKSGKNVFRNALVIDLVRRFVYVLAAGVIAYVKTGRLSLLLTAVVGYLSLILMLNVTRYMSAFLMQFAISQFAVGVFHLIMLLFSDFDVVDAKGYTGVILLPLLAACVALGMLTVAHVQGRWKESYYEK